MIACGRGPKRKRCECGNPGPLLCDWKVGRGKTCDKPICHHHAQHVADDKDLCPEHQIAYAEWLAKRGSTL